jgi:hypothetical protein
MPVEYSINKEELVLIPDVGHPFLDTGKEIIDGNIVEENRGYDSCEEVYRVFADLVDDSRRRNDVNSAWRTGDVVSFTFNKLVDGVWTTANYIPLAVLFTNESYAWYTTIEWRDVLDQDGVGCYRLTTNSSIAGLPQPFIHWQTYTLEPYEIGGNLNPNVIGTSRVLSEFNDVNDFLGLNFTDSRILDSVRLNAKIGYFNDNTEIDMVEYLDGTNEKVKIEDFVSYELRLNLSGFCVIEMLRMHLLQANRQWISDYSYDSYSYLTDDVPVVLKEGLSPEFFDGSRDIKGTVKFRDKISKRRTHFQNNRITAENQAPSNPPAVCPPCPPCPPCPAINTQILKTGQTVTYRTGDDGDVQAGRDVDFLTLPSNNPFSNTFRFTDELGTQVYANNIAIDWSSYNGTNSVLGYLMPFQTDGTANWNAAIDAALAKSIGTFTSGWRLTNLREIQNIFNYGVATARLNYAPFNNAANVNMHLSTTYANLTSQAYYITSSNGATGVFSKTSSFGGRYIACRDFTVTGTVLT